MLKLKINGSKEEIEKFLEKNLKDDFFVNVKKRNIITDEKGNNFVVIDLFVKGEIE